MNEKLEHVDSLRGIAILMVMLVHTAQSVPELPRWVLTITKYGQLGVQLFFVISAFTLCHSADRRSDEKDRDIKYLIRRFFRIAPLYYFGIIWYFLYRSAPTSLGAGSLQPAGGYTLVNMLANFFFVHGFYPPAHNYIVPGGWSIGTEMAFYLCFPVLFLMYRKMNEKGSIHFLILFALMTGCYYFFESWYLSCRGVLVEKNNFLYYNLLNQLPVFTLGILAYFLTRNQVFTRIPIVVDLFFLCLFSWVTIVLWQADSFPPNPFMFVPFTAGLAFVCLFNIFVKIRMLNLSILRRVGQVSYSMYILHFMFAWYAAQYLNRWLGDSGRPIILLGFYYLMTIVLSFALAIVSEKFIEKPGIHAGKMLIQKVGETRS
jgi:peptidoglycan/LPS O-acetylase OafA/YrhL